MKYLLTLLRSVKKWILLLHKPGHPANRRRKLTGWADLEQDPNTGKRMWTTYDLESREVLNMDFSQGLVFDPKEFPNGTQIRIFYPLEP